MERVTRMAGWLRQTSRKRLALRCGVGPKPVARGSSLRILPRLSLALLGQALLGLALLDLGIGGSATARQAGPQAPAAAPVSAPVSAPVAAPDKKAEQRKELRDDSAKLVEMATSLKAEVDKTTQNTLSVAAVKKTEQIEALAKQVKDRMKP